MEYLQYLGNGFQVIEGAISTQTSCENPESTCSLSQTSCESSMECLSQVSTIEKHILKWSKIYENGQSKCQMNLIIWYINMYQFEI